MRTGSTVRPSGFRSATSDQLERPVRLSCSSYGADAGKAIALETRLPTKASRENLILMLDGRGDGSEGKMKRFSGGFSTTLYIPDRLGGGISQLHIKVVL